MPTIPTTLTTDHSLVTLHQILTIHQAHYLSKEIDSVSKNTREILVKLLSNKNMMAPGSIVKSGDFLVNLGFDEEADGAELVEELNKFFTDKSSSLEMPPTIVQDNNIQVSQGSPHSSALTWPDPVYPNFP